MAAPPGGLKHQLFYRRQYHAAANQKARKYCMREYARRTTHRPRSGPARRLGRRRGGRRRPRQDETGISCASRSLTAPDRLHRPFRSSPSPGCLPRVLVALLAGRRTASAAPTSYGRGYSAHAPRRRRNGAWRASARRDVKLSRPRARRSFFDRMPRQSGRTLLVTRARCSRIALGCRALSDETGERRARR